jgi:hypothetical protein
MVVDDSGNVVVTGYSFDETISGYYTVKYAAADGALLWESHFTGPYAYDFPSAVAVDASGNVAVTGSSAGRLDTNGYPTQDFYTAKYAAADGALLWEQRWPEPAGGVAGASAVAVDVNGDVVVTGYAEGRRDTNGNIIADLYVAKYAALDGALLWEKRWSDPAGDLGAGRNVAVDSSGDVVVAGYCRGQFDTNGYRIADLYAAKYAAADGTLLWEQRYDGPAKGDDYASALALDGSGNVVVTGGSASGASRWNYDYYTAKYASSDGALLWEKRYNGPANGSDSAKSLALGPNGLVAVTGNSSHNRGEGFATIVYRENVPPVFTCPGTIAADFSSEAGAVVNFNVTVTDDSGVAPTITCAPASGSVFPIGRTTVTCTATDGDGLSSTCSFTVTVRGARGVHQQVLAELTALRARVRDRDDLRSLDEGITHLRGTVSAALWLDETHLRRNSGEIVFHEDKQVVKKLCDLIKSKKINLSVAVLQGPVDRIFRADRLLAFVAIQDAIRAGESQKKIDQAQKFLAKGDAEAAEERCSNAIEDYRNAWKWE